MISLRSILPLSQEPSLRRNQRLEQIAGNGEHIEYRPGSSTEPPHLIAHGEVKFGDQTSDIQTAINVRPGNRRETDDVEFATCVGYVPRSSLGTEVVERLNHKVDGKFVTFDASRSDRSEVVYTSRRPADWLNEGRVHRELEDHARADKLVEPVLQQACEFSQAGKRLTYTEIQAAAVDIVDKPLDARLRLSERLPAVQYLPKRKVQAAE